MTRLNRPILAGLPLLIGTACQTLRKSGDSFATNCIYTSYITALLPTCGP